MLIQELKNRINSIQSIRKITRAMELVATSKLQRAKKNFEKSEAYYELVTTTYNIFLNNLPKDFKLTNQVALPINLYIVITSDYGLCGAYNNNIFKLIQTVLKPEDQIIVVGSKGLSYFNNLKRQVVYKLINLSDNLNYDELSELINFISAKILTKSIHNVFIISTEYINSITFKPTLDNVLNFKPTKAQPESLNSNRFIHLDPNPETILIKTLPLYLGAIIYGKVVASKVSEIAMRRIAMESATDNADDLIENFSVKYNQARQAIITQEIAEIVGGSDL